MDEQLDRHRAEHGVAGGGETRERIVVALTGGPEGETLIRRAARIASRTRGADLLAVHVSRADGLTGADPASLARQRALTESLGGTYHQVIGDDVPRALLDFATGANATQLVLGASRRSRLARMFSPGVGTTTVARSDSIDVHMITHEEVGGGLRRTGPGVALPRRRRVGGWLLTGLGLPALTAILYGSRDTLGYPSQILLYLLAVVAVALVGGLWPAVTAAVLSFALLNFFFTVPYHTFFVSDPVNLLALIVFLLVAGAVSAIVDLAARRTREAARASAEAEMLSTLAGHVLRGEAALPSLLVRLRETFGLAAVTLLERRPDAPPRPGDQSDPDAWRIVAGAGGAPATCPAGSDTAVVVDEGLVLALRGRLLDAADRRVLEAFGAEAAVALRHQRLAEEAEQAKPLAEADRMRTALLAAVSHDLRSPLASAKAAVESLRSDIEWSVEDRKELLATAEESLEKLNRLIANLLDMSRLQAGVLGVSPSPVALEEIVPLAIDEAGAVADVKLPDELPEVVADPALLESILVNLISNAVRYSPAGGEVLVTAGSHGDHVQIRVVDRGPGIPAEAHERVFLPFQRLGDRRGDTGVGLGLALSRGLAEAMGGTLVPEETPGGGLTMILTLPISAKAAAVPERDPREVHDMGSGAAAVPDKDSGAAAVPDREEDE